MAEKDLRVDEAEEEELKPERPDPPPPPPGSVNANVFNRVALGFSLLGAVFLGMTVTYFAPLTTTSSTIGKHLGGPRFVTPMFLAGIAVTAAAVMFILRRLRPRLDYLKPRQGAWVRRTGYVAFGALALFAAVTVHQLPGARSEWWKITLAQTAFLGQQFTLRPVFFPAAATFVVLLTAWHVIANSPKWVDFQIETQSEMRKVSWPATKEWTGSTVVVVVVMAFMALFLHFVDLGLSWLLEKLKIGI